ncbi:ubiquinone biosynthesis hydroxylase, UbiH/UbiF/VisC/COQ6 family [beta proteobacterium KB13]|uniref:Ubiquinone biosynthesis hydroxylase, UbiH/UbiF/VisC/COQ6 family n=1 Tax=beta proteobacterium KB13 TaxID=314607 RepID=B6BUT8_9PROT|nr:ubiquinone biosynthesis hydroxylase, UbiH/UbiF/VisC/COQ6 family [beta proteobacterium KB13]
MIFALLNAHEKHKIVIHEKLDIISLPKKSRALALSASSIDILKKINIDPKKNLEFIPINKIHTSQKNAYGRVIIDQGESDPVGFVIRYDHLIKNLLDKINANKNISIHLESEVISVNVKESFFRDVNDKKYNYNFLVFSDGIGNLLDNQFEFSVDNEIANYSALVCEVDTQLKHKNIAYERFTPDGPIALLPINNNSLSKLVWTGNNHFIEDLLKLNNNEFIELFNENFGERLGQVLEIGEKIVYPLRQRYMLKPYTENILVLGNAAHTMHPVAGQGLNLTIRDIAYLTILLQKNKYVIDRYTLKEYFDNRVTEMKSFMKLTHFLVKGFSNDYVGINKIRSLSLFLLDNQKIIKDSFINKFNYGSN